MIDTINQTGRLHASTGDAERDAIVESYFAGLKSKSKSGRKHIEDDLQSACIKIFSLKYPDLQRLLFMVNNSGYKNRITTKNGKSISLQAIRDKKMGLVKGVADMILWIPNRTNHGAGIEMKTEVGQQSKEQSLFEMYCGVMKYRYAVIRSTSEFEAFIDSYMSTVDADMIYNLKVLTKNHEEAMDEKALKNFNKLVK